MKIFSNYIITLSLILFIFSCETITQSPSEKLTFSSHQISSCNGSNNLNKVLQYDSCFTYSFNNDKLKIDFCVYGNCCPDSQRFVTDYSIKSDTIFVEVADTAENLCRCICNYTIHIEFTGLPENKYLFFCNSPLTNSEFNYREIIIKK